MIIDKLLKISDAQAVTTSAVGTNVIDIEVARSVGSGTPLAMVFSVGVAADQTTGDEDYTFQVEFATNAAQSTGRQIMGSRVFESGTPDAPAQNADLLVPGFIFAIPLPPVTQDETGDFIGIRYVTSGTTPTITVDAWLAPLMDVSQYVSYADNVTIV